MVLSDYSKTGRVEKLTNRKDMLNACQIPTDIISSLTTEELVGVSMDYPLLIDCFAYSSLLEGINTTIDRFNGFNELIHRGDAAPALFSYLSTDLRTNIVEVSTNLQKGEDEIKHLQSVRSTA